MNVETIVCCNERYDRRVVNDFTCFPDTALLVPTLVHVVGRGVVLLAAGLYRITTGLLKARNNRS